MSLVTIKVNEETRRQAKAAAALKDMSMIDWIHDAVKKHAANDDLIEVAKFALKILNEETLELNFYGQMEGAAREWIEEILKTVD